MFSITSLQMLKKADVWVIIVTTAASALIVDTDADAVVIVAVFITCVTTAGVFAFTHIIAVTGDTTFVAPFSLRKS